MTKEELTHLKNTLEQEKKAILDEITKIAHKDPLVKGDYEANITPSDPSDTSDEKADKVNEYEINRAVEHDLQTRLKQITMALEKIASESYGTCSNCRSPIEDKRLQAIPTAFHCINCAQKIQLI